MPTTEISSDQRTLAMLAHLLGIFTGFLGALVIWLVKREESGFVENQAKEALNFQITVLLLSIVGMVLSLVLIGFLILIAVWVGNLIFSIIGAISAYSGQRYRYPMTLRLIA